MSQGRSSYLGFQEPSHRLPVPGGRQDNSWSSCHWNRRHTVLTETDRSDEGAGHTDPWPSAGALPPRPVLPAISSSLATLSKVHQTLPGRDLQGDMPSRAALGVLFQDFLHWQHYREWRKRLLQATKLLFSSTFLAREIQGTILSWHTYLPRIQLPQSMCSSLMTP